MAWVRIDDQFPDRYEMLMLTADAFRLYVSSICDCAKNYPDDLIPHRTMDRKQYTPSVCNELVRAGLWGELHDYDGSFVGFRLLPSVDYSYEIQRDYSYLLYRDAIFSRDGYACINCGATDDLTLDHIKPISKGGTNDIANLQTLCRSCNSKKGARLE